MPTYEYECQKCGYRFDKFQNITADPLKRCPACRGKVQRIIHGGAALLFKGSGFYCTDKHDGPSSTKTATETKSCEGTDSPACEKCPRKED